MRFQLPSKKLQPREYQTREVVRFMWLPIITDERELVWLERMKLKQIFERGRWVAIEWYFMEEAV